MWGLLGVSTGLPAFFSRPLTVLVRQNLCRGSVGERTGATEAGSAQPCNFGRQGASLCRSEDKVPREENKSPS